MSRVSEPTAAIDTTGQPGAADDTAADHLASAWHDLSIRFHRIQCTLDRELHDRHQLTASEFEVLEQLCAADGHSLRMNDLAGEVHLTQSALSRVVGRLEKDGLVHRTMCATDRRSVFAALTPAGITRYDQARPTQRRILAELCVGCPDLLREQAR
ncbi:MarR family transcriptional regulator [Gordonia sp. VNQ95]|jgi:DNA-binding MarR family transcriptional regulator|uniref:MarR family winged helix-turn-helix transcriptional regulator n=1 Tax=Gordonia TaxID=2053 RepID=UPI0032B4A475